MSERITAANLDEVIKRNEVIEEQMKQSASLIWSKYNPMQINSPIQLALQILRPYGLIQLPIDNHYLSGAIFVRDGKRIPLINTALPRANQYFTAWHEIYHLLFDEVSFDHLIESEILMEERKAEYFAALMLLGNLMPYFEGLKDMEFQAKAFQCIPFFFAFFGLSCSCAGRSCFLAFRLRRASIISPQFFSLMLFLVDFPTYFIARQQACIQIAATIYTQARLRTSLFCFLLYQLSLWWVKYRAQPEAINP